MLTLQSSTQHKNKIIKLLSRKIKIEIEATENESKMKLELKQNIGMSVHIAVVDTTQKGNEMIFL